MSGHFPTSSSISSACRHLKFTAPPSSKKILKKRFLELAKENHPDRAKAKGLNVDAATKKMASLTEAYKTLEEVLKLKSGGGGINNGTFIRPEEGNGNGAGRRGGAQDVASAGFGMGENINATERDESPDAQGRRRDMLERTWLPWLKNRREHCFGARPLAEEVIASRYVYGHKIAVYSLRGMMTKFWNTFVPARGRQMLLNAGVFVQQKSVKMIRAAKFVASGK